MAFLIAAILLQVSCRKEAVIAGNGTEAYVNFYNASEVLRQGNFDLPVPVGGITKFGLSEQNMIYVNDSIPRPPLFGFHTNNSWPAFAIGNDDMRQYPSYSSGSISIVDDIGRAENNVYWMPLASGFYRFIYTAVYKNYLVREGVQLEPKTYTTQYLTEDPASDSAYRVVSMPAYPYAAAGKVRLQVVHLSPDAGTVDVYRMDKDGNRQGNAIVRDLAFGNHNEYADIDTTGASATYGNLVFGFYKAGTANKLYSVGVPATSKASFITVIQGFANATARRIIVNANGYTTVTWQVTPDLRVNVRRVS
ncbi:DUF4397 domain-containing protein [Chitinophaga barathri]|uniref:DUF4397 domain-containing protein n=1 Tax=Chitinophaga barathri TaxID=1647451 RepID=A0A3N4MDN3_9BACT|nr:DUF4397 domain-containing protein [Chitinophaga barathri]RPD42062.1 DUF4397 domain-containing protein [Chitinophaga barathri]